MKRSLSLILVMCMFCVHCMFVSAADISETVETNKVMLSSLEPEECVKFLINQGVCIPETFSSVKGYEVAIKVFVEELEANPDRIYGYSYSVVLEIIEDIRSVIRNYYNIPESISVENVAPLNTNQLQYSTFVSFRDEMLFYNCYAYAIDHTDACEPGSFSDQTYDWNADIGEVAEIVKDDLQQGHYNKCVKLDTNRPSVRGNWTNVIAVRKNTTNAGYKDYHFARLGNDSWFHKPSIYGVLEFINLPDNNIIWTNEAAQSATAVIPATTEYNSNIIYISYKANHNIVSEWTGNHYHSGTSHYYEYIEVCNDCGETFSTSWTNLPCSGSPCPTPWNLRNSE